MIFVQEIEPGVFASIDGDVITGTGDDAVRHPRAILAQWSAQELAEIGVHGVDPAPIPPGKIVTARTFARDESGDVVEVTTLADAPASAAELTIAIANRRWLAETGGVIWGGWPVATDRDSQAKILAEYVAATGGARADGAPWKFADGQFRELSNTEMVSMALAVRAHVAACFALEATLLAQLAAGEIGTYAEIDAAGWPPAIIG